MATDMPRAAPVERCLYLPQVTLCAVTSVNVAATVRALEVSLDQIRFGACKLLTDAKVSPTGNAHGRQLGLWKRAMAMQ